MVGDPPISKVIEDHRGARGVRDEQTQVLFCDGITSGGRAPLLADIMLEPVRGLHVFRNDRVHPIPNRVRA